MRSNQRCTLAEHAGACEARDDLGGRRVDRHRAALPQHGAETGYSFLRRLGPGAPRRIGVHDGARFRARRADEILPLTRRPSLVLKYQ